MKCKISRGACTQQSHRSGSTVLAVWMLPDKTVSHDWLCECAIQVQARLRYELKLEAEIVLFTVRAAELLHPPSSLHLWFSPSCARVLPPSTT